MLSHCLGVFLRNNLSCLISFKKMLVAVKLLKYRQIEPAEKAGSLLYFKAESNDARFTCSIINNQDHRADEEPQKAK